MWKILFKSGSSIPNIKNYKCKHCKWASQQRLSGQWGCNVLNTPKSAWQMVKSSTGLKITPQIILRLQYLSKWWICFVLSWLLSSIWGPRRKRAAEWSSNKSPTLFFNRSVILYTTWDELLAFFDTGSLGLGKANLCCVVLLQGYFMSFKLPRRSGVRLQDGFSITWHKG